MLLCVCFYRLQALNVDTTMTLYCFTFLSIEEPYSTPGSGVSTISGETTDTNGGI